jgi:hypothetical protein
VKNPIRNETSLILVVAVIFSAVAIPVLSGFLEPSQPPTVAAIQIGEAPDADRGAERGDRASDTPAKKRPPAKRRRTAPRASAAAPAPSTPADDAAEDDGGEAD